MPHISLQDLKPYADGAKLVIGSIDADREASAVRDVFSQLAQSYDVSLWVDEASTPALVQQILAMHYCGWLYLSVYSEEEDVSNYGRYLLDQMQKLIDGIIAGTLTLTDSSQPAPTLSGPVFYPTDISSAQEPTSYDSSLGGPVFSMGTVW